MGGMLLLMTRGKASERLNLVLQDVLEEQTETEALNRIVSKFWHTTSRTLSELATLETTYNCNTGTPKDLVLDGRNVRVNCTRSGTPNSTLLSYSLVLEFKNASGKTTAKFGTTIQASGNYFNDETKSCTYPVTTTVDCSYMHYFSVSGNGYRPAPYPYHQCTWSWWGAVNTGASCGGLTHESVGDNQSWHAEKCICGYGQCGTFVCGRSCDRRGRNCSDRHCPLWCCNVHTVSCQKWVSRTCSTTVQTPGTQRCIKTLPRVAPPVVVTPPPPPPAPVIRAWNCVCPQAVDLNFSGCNNFGVAHNTNQQCPDNRSGLQCKGWSVWSCSPIY